MKFNDFRRIEIAVNNQEPDRVPLIETMVDYKIQSCFLGKEVTGDDLKRQVEFWKKAGYDYVPLNTGLMQPGEVTEESNIVKALGIADKLGEGELINHMSVINSWKDVEKIDWNQATEIDFTDFKIIKKYLPEEMKTIVVTGKIFTLPWILMGFENFCESLYTRPDLVEEVIKQVSKIQVDSISRTTDFESVRAVWLADDLAFGSSLIVSREHLKKHIYPVYRKIIEICHDKDIMVFFHSDGYILPIISDIIELGFDALHPIDPTAEGLDIKDIKGKYGDKIALFGNVDVDMLATGSCQEVQERVRYLLKNIAPGGGYLLGSGNSVPGWVKFKNYETMVETAIREGEYPIKKII